MKLVGSLGVLVLLISTATRTSAEQDQDGVQDKKVYSAVAESCGG